MNKLDNLSKQSIKILEKCQSLIIDIGTLCGKLKTLQIEVVDTKQSSQERINTQMEKKFSFQHCRSRSAIRVGFLKVAVCQKILTLFLSAKSFRGQHLILWHILEFIFKKEKIYIF